MIGQLSDNEFRNEYPSAYINNGTRTAVTRFGKYTINYWIQHEDYSWTNYKCQSA